MKKELPSFVSLEISRVDGFDCGGHGGVPVETETKQNAS